MHKRNPHRVKVADYDLSVPYLNRELSWLDFNARVLEEALCSDNPLLEQLKFLSIFTSNLDEFFMVRIPFLKKTLDKHTPVGDSPDKRPTEKILSVIRTRYIKLLNLRDDHLINKILPKLKTKGIDVTRMSDTTNAEREELRRHFEALSPILNTQKADSVQSFTIEDGIATYVLCRLEDGSLQVVDIPEELTLIPLSNKKHKFVLGDDLVAYFAGELFDSSVKDAYPVRITRDWEAQLANDEVLSKREITRLEVHHEMPGDLLSFLQRLFNLKDEDIYCIGKLTCPENLAELYDLPFPHLKNTPFEARQHIFEQQSAFKLLSDKDILVHHPFESFNSVLSFLEQAATDPDVISIKQTLYRTSEDSPIMKHLTTAVNNGKKVTLVVELKARFDEENNLEWAQELKKAGAEVIISPVSLKIHCKALSIVRKEGNDHVFYTHLSTGNYNNKTANLYTDLGLFTKDQEIGSDVNNLFNFIKQLSAHRLEDLYEGLPRFKKIYTAPVTLRENILQLIEDEIKYHKQEGDGLIIVKLNGLIDAPIIDKLYEASQVGVKIKLLVRGICCLKPGIPDMSENIEVISIVDRFLEHSRIYSFGTGDRRKVFLGSADWMPRNMDLRIEIMFPIEDKEIKKRLVNQILATYFSDNCKARELLPNGMYRIRTPLSSESKFRSQAELMKV